MKRRLYPQGTQGFLHDKSCGHKHEQGSTKPRYFLTERVGYRFHHLVRSDGVLPGHQKDFTRGFIGCGRLQKGLDQIIHVYEMVEVFASSYHEKHLPVDPPEKFQEPPVTRSVGLRDSYHHNGQPVFVREDKPFTFQLRLPVDVVRVGRSVLVNNTLHLSVHPDRTSMHETLHSRLDGGFEHVPRTLHVYIRKMFVRNVHLVLGCR